VLADAEGKKIDWKYDHKGRKITKEEQESQGDGGKKGKKAKTKTPEPEEEPSCRQDAITSFKEVLSSFAPFLSPLL